MRKACLSNALILVLACFVPDLVADGWVNDHLVHRTPKYTAGGDQACLRCHSGDKMRAIADSVHGNTEKPHTPFDGHGCESCHGEGSIHVSRAHGGRGFPPLTEFGRGSDKAPRDLQLAACLDCHADPEYTPKPEVFLGSAHDRKSINCSTCHTAHARVDPMNERADQQATCFRCHRKMKEEHPQFRGRDVNFDRVSCSACHDVHEAKAEAP